MITTTLIQERIDHLRQREQSILADLNAIGGAIQDCQFWLAFVSDADKAKTPDAQVRPNLHLVPPPAGD